MPLLISLFAWSCAILDVTWARLIRPLLLIAADALEAHATRAAEVPADQSFDLENYAEQIASILFDNANDIS